MQNTKPVIRSVNSEPDPLTVEVLELALEMARAGDLRSVVVVGDCKGGIVYSNHSTRSLLALYGALAYAQTELTMGVLDRYAAD